MSIPRPRSRALLLTTGLLGLLACSGSSSEQPTDGASPDVSESGVAEGVIDDPSERVRRLREVGPSGEIPTAFTIKLTQAAFESSAVGKTAPEGTVLTFAPAVEGTLTVTATDELTFSPAAGFAPGTDYTATLEAVANAEERHEAPVADGVNPWTRAFSTPDFALSRLSLVQRDFKRKQLVVDLVFTGPVDLAEVEKRLTVRFDGARIRPTKVVAGPRGSIVRMTLQGGSLDEGELVASVGAGVPLQGGAVTAPAGSQSLDIAAGQPIKIESVLVKEGVSGHYLEVVCNDPAAGGERWYWDRDTYDGWWTSSRCMGVPESVAASVRVEPAVAFTVAEAPAGFRLFGDFDEGKVTITLDAGLQTVDGGVLTEAWEGSLRVPQRTPTLSLAAKGRYLPKSAWRNLPLRHLNVDEATLTVRHIPEENLVFWLGGEEPAMDRTSNVIFEKELALGGVVNEEQTTWVDVGGMLPDVGKGVYELSLEEKDGSARDTARLLLTDLQLLAKRSTPTPGMPYSDEINVWALDTHTTDPVAGTEVTLVRPSGQAVARCRTNGQGACTLAVPEPGVDKTPPFALLARKGSDLTYLKFADLELQSDADTTGRPWFTAQPEEGEDAVSYVAAAWTDRGVYRPGETAHVAALLRGEAFTAPEGGLPVVVKLYDPRGKEVRRKAVTTDAAGLLTQDLPFADYATTGRYRVALEVAEREVGETTFNVEEFVPERMAAQASAEAGGYRITDAVPVDVEARWLFGGSAKGSKVEVDCRVEPSPFRPAKNAAFHYGLADTGERTLRPLTLGAVGGRLGEEGTETFACPSAGAGAASLGPAKLIADVAVFEGDSGRTTRAVATTPLHPAEIYLGTRANTDRLERGQTATIDGVVVDWQGNTLTSGAPSEIEVEIFRLEEEYGWWWDDDDQSSSYRRLLRRASEGRQTIPVRDGTFTLQHEAKSNAAGWVAVFTHGDAITEQYIEGKGRYWWSPRDSTVDQTPRPRRPTALDLTIPDKARVGEDFAVRFTAPYPGRALVSIETDRVTRWEWLTVDAGEVTWTTEVDEFAPNVYVSAFLIKDPHLESADAYLPDRAYGVESLTVEPEAFIHSVALEVPKEVRPYSSFDVGITVKDAAGQPVTGDVTATIAVVDEGVLSLTGFETPDPTKQVFARRRLGVDSFETVGWSVLMQPEGPSSSTGGDGVGDGGRVQMVKPVALWSGPVKVENGRAKVPFEVPGYRGQLRVMAVAASADRMGHAQADVIVRDPIVVQTTLPRFLSEGDLAQIPVFLSNMSGKERGVTVRLEVEDLTTRTSVAAVEPKPVAELVGDDKGYLSLKDGESGTVVFQVKANRAPAAARFRVVAEADNLKSKEELELPIQPKLPEDRRTSRVALTGTVDLDEVVAGQGWLEGADRTTYWITTNPYADTLTHLRYLIRYPYGCIEQTSSSTRPLLYVSNLVEFIDPSLVNDTSIDDMVQHGIDRVLSMQTPSGGFGYWPGASYPSEWGTAYGTHMLLDAKKAGHAVPEQSLRDALEWLERRVERSDGAADSTEAYATYVLALGGKDVSAKAEAVLKRLGEVDPKDRKYRYRGRGWKAEAEYLAMAAMHLSGDQRHEAALKALDTSAVDTTRSNGWSFYSDRRRRALMLSVYTDVFGVPKQDSGGGTAAELVAQSLRGKSGRYTTQEMAWGITALGKRVAALDAKLPQSTVTLGRKTLQPTQEGQGTNRAWAISGATGVDDLELSLKGDAQAWLVTTTEGVRATDDLPVGGEGLTVTRSYLTSDGQPVDFGRHTLGDTVYVKVTLANRTGRTQQNLALVDRLPAGWEIENPRLGRGSLPEWVNRNELWQVDHMNLRDDRLEVFGELRSGWTRTVVYEVRAVTAGSFTIPDVRAEAMYDPELWARQRGQSLDIQGPWDRFLL